MARKLFADWYAEHAKRLGIDADPNNPEHHYDYKAAYEAGAEPDATGHWPSAYKTEGHPRMYVRTKAGFIKDTKTGMIMLSTKEKRRGLPEKQRKIMPE